MCTPCLRYHSIDCSNGPFGGGIRFPSFQNENEPQCPPCGRQIAARLPSVPALPWELQMQSCPFKIGKRGKKNIDEPLPGGVANPAQEASVREKAKGTFRCCSSPLSFVYLFRLPTRPSGISSPCTLDWVGWMNVTRRDQLLLKWDVQLFRAKFLPLCVRRGFLYERGLCPQLVQQVCTHSTDIGGLQWRLSAEAPLSAGSLCLDNSTRSKK